MGERVRFNVYVPDALAAEVQRLRDAGALDVSAVCQQALARKVATVKREKKRGAFIPPTVAQVAAYCAEHGHAVDAGQFVDYYAMRNWIPKGASRQMSDWHAAVRTWVRHGKAYGGFARPAARPINGNEVFHSQIAALKPEKE